MTEEYDMEKLVARIEILESLVFKMFRALILKENHTINPGEWKIDQ